MCIIVVDYHDWKYAINITYLLRPAGSLNILDDWYFRAACRHHLSTSQWPQYHFSGSPQSSRQ
jgi:hypothetical protein